MGIKFPQLAEDLPVRTLAALLGLVPGALVLLVVGSQPTTPGTSCAATTLILGAALGWIFAPKAARAGWKNGLRAALAVAVWAVGIGAFLVAALWTDYGAILPALWVPSVVGLGLVGLVFTGIPMVAIVFAIAVLWVAAVRATVRRRSITLSTPPHEIGIAAGDGEAGLDRATVGRIVAALLWCCLAAVMLLVGLFSLGSGILVWVVAFTPLGLAELAIGVLLLRRSLGPAAAVSAALVGVVSSALGLWALANSSEDVVVVWTAIFIVGSLAATLYASLSWRFSPARAACQGRTAR